jgi:hypothetical protein
MATPVGISQQVHPLENLIGGPLQAIVRADAMAAQSSLQFFEEIGFEPRRDKESPTIRTMDFTYTHPVPDPANPGTVIDTPTTVRVPVISMLSIPNLTISETNVDFNVRIVGFASIKKNEKASETSVIKLPFSIQGIFTSRPPIAVAPANGDPFTISISIKMKKEVMPEAEKRILALLDDAILSHPIKEETKREETKENRVRDQNKKVENKEGREVKSPGKR